MIRKPAKQSAPDKIIFEQEKGYYGVLGYGYRSVSVAAGEGRAYTSHPGSAHEERDRKRLIAQSREFMRNNAIYKGMIERMVSYIAGNGFELQLSGASKAAVKKGEDLWKKFNRRPEIRGILSGSKTARMVLREVVVAGDTAVLKTNKGLVQLFEAEQIDSKSRAKDKAGTVSNGIVKDTFGRPVKFNLCPWGTSSVNVTKGKMVGAADVMYLTDPERPSQVRGVPACQASFPMLHRINDVCDSEAIAWQLLSRIAISIEREQGNLLGHVESKEDTSKSSAELEGNLAQRLTELGYALIFQAKPGEKVTGIERNIPGKNFSDSVRMFLRLLGLPIGLPLELILLDWSKANYSQSRAVLEQAYETFTGWQQMLEDFYYGPLFEWKIGQWKKDNLIAGGTNFKVEWIKKTFPWIDQLKEAQAYATQVERGFTTHSRVCKSLNLDQGEVVAKRGEEITRAIEIVQGIEKQTGVEVPWQYFAGIKPGLDKKDTAAEADIEDGDDKKEKQDE